MSKLLKLKEWLTVPETARHLSIMFGEEVKEADVLRLCLDGHLKLSVNFVNHARARRGEKFITPEEWEKEFREVASWESAQTMATVQGLIAVIFSDFGIVFYLKNDEVIENGPWAFGPDERLKSTLLSKWSVEKQDEVLNHMIEGALLYAKKQSETYHGKIPPTIHSFERYVDTINGVYDLPMLGTERLDVEQKYQMLTNGPEVTLVGLDGAFVEDEEGVIWQLQNEFDEEYINAMESEERKKKSLEFYAEHVKKRVTKNEINEQEAEKLLEQHKIIIEKPREHDARYYPAGGLPDDCVLVVRTNELREFEHLVSEKTRAKSVKENPKVLASLLKIIITMAVKGYVYNHHAKKSEVPSEIVKDAEQLGLAIDADTVRKWLKEAAELLDQDLP